jgi:hypothetical protein
MELLRPLLNSSEKVLKSRGIKGLIAHNKALRLSLLHYLSGEFPKKKIEGVKLDVSGFPKILGNMKSNFNVLSKQNVHLVRLVLTALFSTRAVSIGTAPDVRSIKEPAQLELPILESYVAKF